MFQVRGVATPDYLIHLHNLNYQQCTWPQSFCCFVYRAERVIKENEAKLARRLKGDEKRAAIKREVLEEQTRRVENTIVSSVFVTLTY